MHGRAHHALWVRPRQPALWTSLPAMAGLHRRGVTPAQAAPYAATPFGARSERRDFELVFTDKTNGSEVLRLPLAPGTVVRRSKYPGADAKMEVEVVVPGELARRVLCDQGASCPLACHHQAVLGGLRGLFQYTCLYTRTDRARTALDAQREPPDAGAPIWTACSRCTRRRAPSNRCCAKRRQGQRQGRRRSLRGPRATWSSPSPPQGPS